MFDARLGANELVFGPSPKARAAMTRAMDEVWQYGDPENWDLREALAKKLGISTDEIAVAGGIDGLLGLTVRIFMNPGDAVITSDGAYPTFNYHVAGFGGQLHKVAYDVNHEDPVGLAEAARAHDAAIVYFANPDNPMGTWHDASSVESLADTVPDSTMLCLDEAYVEFAPEGTAPKIDTSRPNLLRFRTFSKAYGLAGARVGYVFGHRAAVSQFNKVRDHFGMNRMSQAGALAALADEQWLAFVLTSVAEGNERLAQIARAVGFNPLPSGTNFVTMDCGRGADFAVALVASLAERGVFVRMPFAEPHRHCIRVSAAPELELAIFEAVLPDAIKAAAHKAGA